MRDASVGAASRGRHLVTLDAGFTIAEALDRLRGRPEVEYAEPNAIFRASQARRVTLNDTFFASQWHLELIDAPRTWAIQSGDRSVVVAVLDTGIAYEDFGPFRKAPDFGSTVFVPGFDFINNDTHANDDNFHGTHVASVIAEATNNGIGVAGLAFGTALMPVKVLDAEGFGDTFSIAEGIDFAAASNDVKVINMSLGGGGTSGAISTAITRAVGRGITVVAAAGNDGEGTVSFPANLSNVIAVGAIDGRKIRAPYSNFGSALDVVAPGGDIRRDDVGPGAAARRPAGRDPAADLRPGHRGRDRPLRRLRVLLRRRDEPGLPARRRAGRAALPPGDHRSRGDPGRDRVHRRGPRRPRTRRHLRPRPPPPFGRPHRPRPQPIARTSPS